jgi:hypothetical protein
MEQDFVFDIKIDEENQIIRQYFSGQIKDEDAIEISKKTEELVEKLKNPHKVKILAVFFNIKKIPPKVRKQFITDLKRENLYKVAFVGFNYYVAALIYFFILITNKKKVRIFSLEQEAIEWLNK